MRESRNGTTLVEPRVEGANSRVTSRLLHVENGAFPSGCSWSWRYVPGLPICRARRVTPKSFHVIFQSAPYFAALFCRAIWKQRLKARRKHYSPAMPANEQRAFVLLQLLCRSINAGKNVRLHLRNKLLVRCFINVIT